MHEGLNVFFIQKQNGNKGMDEKKINKNLKNCPKSSRFTVPQPAKKLQIFPKNIKQPFWEEEQRAVLFKEILGVRLSNLDMKDKKLL